MAALKDIKVTMQYDFSKDKHDRIYTSEVLSKMADDFNNSDKFIPIVTNVANQRLILGKVDQIEVNDQIVTVNGTIYNGGSYEEAMIEYKDLVIDEYIKYKKIFVKDMIPIAFSLIAGLPILVPTGDIKESM